MSGKKIDLCCPECGGSVVIQEQKKKDYNWETVMWCQKCDWIDKIDNINIDKYKNKGKK